MLKKKTILFWLKNILLVIAIIFSSIIIFFCFDTKLDSEWANYKMACSRFRKHKKEFMSAAENPQSEFYVFDQKDHLKPWDDTEHYVWKRRKSNEPKRIEFALGSNSDEYCQIVYDETDELANQKSYHEWLFGNTPVLKNIPDAKLSITINDLEIKNIQSHFYYVCEHFGLPIYSINPNNNEIIYHDISRKVEIQKKIKK